MAECTSILTASCITVTIVAVTIGAEDDESDDIAEEALAADVAIKQQPYLKFSNDNNLRCTGFEMT